MAGISFSKEPRDIWIVAGWAFRQVIKDIMAAYPNDCQIQAECAEAEALGFLHVDYLEGEMADKVRDAICHVANEILAGAIQSKIADEFKDRQTLDEYAVGLRGLVAICEAAKAA